MSGREAEKTEAERRRAQAAAEKQARLKAALRANLHRRKGQARARDTGAEETDGQGER
jgi:hypothetical protein